MRLTVSLGVASMVLVWMVLSVGLFDAASAGVIAYEYIYSTSDGAGSAAAQPPTSGVPADSTHVSPYTTYSSGELNDGYSFIGSYGGGFYSTGYQVAAYPNATVHPSIVAEFADPYSLSQISVNYMVDLRVGVCAPESVALYFSTDGTNWSTPNVVSGWDNTNPSYDGRGGDPMSDLYTKTIDTSGMDGALLAKYVRMDVYRDAYTIGLVEIGFAGSAVPEPSALALSTIAGLGLLLGRRRPKG